MKYTEWLQVFDIGDSIYSRVLYAQSALETGNWTSNIFRQCKNLFGMRPARIRDRYWIDIYDSNGNGEFAMYPDLSYSLGDRVDWDDYNDIKRPVFDSDVSDYLFEVQSNKYAGDSKTYVDKVKQRYQDFFPYDFPLGSELIKSVGEKYEGVGLNNSSEFPQNDPDSSPNFSWSWVLGIVLGIIGIGWLMKSGGVSNTTSDE